MDTPASATPSDRRRSHPFPWLDAAISEPYYLLHLITFFYYFAARSSALAAAADGGGDSDRSRHLLRREIQAAISCAMLITLKSVKSETWETFLADALFFAKGFLLVVALLLDYRMACCYLLAFIVIYALAQPPPCVDLGDAKHLTPLQLESLLADGTASRFWLVEFRAASVANCVIRSRIIPELSVIYSNKKFSFGIVDLGQFPSAAELFGISQLDRLPVYILFDKTTEIARYPELSGEYRTFMPKIKKSILINHFELDKRLVEYLSN